VKKSKLPPGSTVFVIARHSPGKGQSITTEKGVLDDYLEFNQLNCIEWFIDAGESGSNRNRKEFSRFQKLVESRPKRLVDGVIFYDLSRLGRDFHDTQYTLALLRRRGYIPEWIIGEQYDGLPGAIMEVATNYKNAEFLDELKIKIRNGLRRMFRLRDEQGQYVGFWAGSIPWGFVGVKKTLPVLNSVVEKFRERQCIVPDYDLWPLGVELYQLRANGLTCREIENKTHLFGSRGTVDISDVDVLTTAYRNLYRNTIYKGVLTFQELIIPDYVPAMITEDLWQAANATSVAHKRGNWPGYRVPKAGKAGPDFLLAGLCECGLCQAPFYTKVTSMQSKTIQYRYYSCRTRRQNGASACESPHVPAVPFEQAILDHAVNKYLRGGLFEDMVEEWTRTINDAPDPIQEIKRLEAEILEISKKLRNLARLAQNGGDFEELGEQVRALKLDRQSAEFKLAQLQVYKPVKKLALSPDKVRRIVETWTERLIAVGEVRPTLNQLVHRIRINQTQARIVYNPPLAFTESGLQRAFGKYQAGYVIQLPLNNHLSEK
jgi:hypothetical protein